LFVSSETHGLWSVTAPRAPSTRELREDLKTDVVIVGGGYTGLSTALHLRERGIGAVVLEAADIGFGASGRNVGLVNAGMWVMPDVIDRNLGQPHAGRLLELLGGAPRIVFDLVASYGIECEALNSGTLHCGKGPRETSELEQRYSQWTARGAPVKLLSARETAERTGSSEFDAALLDLRAGTIQPLAYVRGLARAAIDLGAGVFTLSPAERCDRAGSGWRVHTAAGSVTAEWVVVATDAYARGPWSSVRTSQIHLPYFNFATVPLSPEVRASILPNREGAWDARRILSSFRTDAAGRLIFGSVGALGPFERKSHEAWARRALKRLYPQIDPIEFETGWFGNIGMTADNVPRFFKLDSNVVAFCGYNGRGIAPGTVFGRVMAEYVSGALGEASLPLAPSRPSRPALSAVRELIYRAGAQAVHTLSVRS
jgi:glycine/D-amino acid oxidase-like deaminating enzyme